MEGAVLHLSKIPRQSMGAYLCIASNGGNNNIQLTMTLVTPFPHETINLASIEFNSIKLFDLVPPSVSKRFMLRVRCKYETINTDLGSVVRSHWHGMEWKWGMSNNAGVCCQCSCTERDGHQPIGGCPDGG